MRKNICVGLILAAMLVWGPALQASPQDVRGSGNVAVASYRNNSGIFVLWSSGRITDNSGKEVNAASAYDSGPAVAATPLKGQVYGSANVAVAANCNAEGTYILFSNGALKKPRHSGAAAPLSAQGRMVTGVKATAGMIKSGENGWTCSVQTRSMPYYMEIVFNKKFTQTPSVQYQCLSHLENAAILNSFNALDVKQSCCRATASGFKIYFSATGTNPNSPNSRQYSDVPYAITFVACEDM